MATRAYPVMLMAGWPNTKRAEHPPLTGQLVALFRFNPSDGGLGTTRRTPPGWLRTFPVRSCWVFFNAWAVRLAVGGSPRARPRRFSDPQTDTNNQGKKKREPRPNDLGASDRAGLGRTSIPDPPTMTRPRPRYGRSVVGTGTFGQERPQGRPVRVQAADLPGPGSPAFFLFPERNGPSRLKV